MAAVSHCRPKPCLASQGRAGVLGPAHVEGNGTAFKGYTNLLKCFQFEHMPVNSMIMAFRY